MSRWRRRGNRSVQIGREVQTIFDVVYSPNQRSIYDSTECVQLPRHIYELSLVSAV